MLAVLPVYFYNANLVPELHVLLRGSTTNLLLAAVKASVNLLLRFYRRLTIPLVGQLRDTWYTARTPPANSTATALKQVIVSARSVRSATLRRDLRVLNSNAV